MILSHDVLRSYGDVLRFFCFSSGILRFFQGFLMIVQGFLVIFEGLLRDRPFPSQNTAPQATLVKRLACFKRLIG